MTRPDKVDAETFIKMWQLADSAKEVAQRLGASLNTVCTRAMIYRRKGVPLKKFKGGPTENWEDLAKLADQLSPRLPSEGDGRSR